jgi:hypothetical protein
MLRFSMKNHRVVIDPVSLSLECLRQIWTADKSATKQTATDMLTYIHLVSQVDQDAPFAKVDPADVAALVKREIYGKYDYEFKGKLDEEFMANAAMSYQVAFDTPEMAAVRVYDKKIYEINKVIADTNIQIKEVAIRGGKDFISNFPIINKMMHMTKINAAREALRSSIIRQQSTLSVRGQKTVSYLEKRRAEMIQAGVIKKDDKTPPTQEDMEGTSSIPEPKKEEENF